MEKCTCNNIIKTPSYCMKCKNKPFCSNSCLVQHNFSIHQLENMENENFKPKLSVSKRPNLSSQDNENNNNTLLSEKYNYKNFHVVKIGSNRQILGKGAFAEVCLVKHKQDGLFYAMKIIEKKKLKSNAAIIKQEIKNHLQFDHPNIIKLLNYSETQDFFYLAMEYAENGNLFQEVRKVGKLNEITAKKYFTQTLEAVCYLHERGYTHRDIKPENLLLDRNKNIKLCDFGGTVLLEDNQERKTFFGTYEYMAPEIIEGNTYNSSVDIWALGILLYELLHGYSPFRVTDKQHNIKEYYQIYENIISQEKLEIDRSLSIEVTDLIKLLLVKDRTKRITCDQVLLHPWLNSKLSVRKVNRHENNTIISSKSNSTQEKEDSQYSLNDIKNKVREAKKQDSIQIQKQTAIIEEHLSNNIDNNFFDKLLSEVKKKNTFKKKSFKKSNDDDEVNLNLTIKSTTPRSIQHSDFLIDNKSDNHANTKYNNQNIKHLENRFKEELEIIDEKMKIHNVKKQSLLDKSKTIYNELSTRITNNNLDNKSLNNLSDNKVSNFNNKEGKKEIIGNKYYLEESTDFGSMKPEVLEYNHDEDINHDKKNDDEEYLKIMKNLNFDNKPNSNNISAINTKIKQKDNKFRSFNKLNSYQVDDYEVKENLKKTKYKDVTISSQTTNINKSSLQKKNLKRSLENEVIEIGEVFNEDFHDNGEENILDVLENVTKNNKIRKDKSGEKKQTKGFFDKMFDNILKPFKCGD